MSAELEAAIAAAQAWLANATPEQLADMHKEQHESWRQAFAPCGHRDPDWETCLECRAAYAPQPESPHHE